MTNNNDSTPVLLNRIEKITFATNIPTETLEDACWIVDSSCSGMHEINYYETFNEEFDSNYIVAIELKPFAKESKLITFSEPVHWRDVDYPEALHEMFGISEQHLNYVKWGGLLEASGELDDALTEEDKYIMNAGSDSSWEVDLSEIQSSIESNPSDYIVIMRCVFNGAVELANAQELANFDTFDHEDSLEYDDESQMAMCIYKE